MTHPTGRGTFSAASSDGQMRFQTKFKGTLKLNSCVRRLEPLFVSRLKNCPKHPFKNLSAAFPTSSFAPSPSIPLLCLPVCQWESMLSHSSVKHGLLFSLTLHWAQCVGSVLRAYTLLRMPARCYSSLVSARQPGSDRLARGLLGSLMRGQTIVLARRHATLDWVRGRLKDGERWAAICFELRPIVCSWLWKGQRSRWAEAVGSWHFKSPVCKICLVFNTQMKSVYWQCNKSNLVFLWYLSV